MSAALNCAADLDQMRLHGRGVAIGHDEAGAFSFCRTDGAENVSPFRALIVWCAWPGSAPRPSAGYFVLLSDPGLVLEPDLYLRARREPLPDRRQSGGKVFLKSSMTSVS